MHTEVRRIVLAAFCAAAVTLAPAPSAAYKQYFVFFGRDSATLSDEAKAVIAEFNSTVQAENCHLVELYGHTDGVEVDSLELSLRRAKAVRNEIYRLGMLRSVVVHIHGLGFSEPMVRTNDPEPQNRRVLLNWCPRKFRERLRDLAPRLGAPHSN